MQSGTLAVPNAPFELKGRSVYVAGHRGMVGSALVRRLAPEEMVAAGFVHESVGRSSQA